MMKTFKRTHCSSAVSASSPDGLNATHHALWDVHVLAKVGPVREVQRAHELVLLDGELGYCNEGVRLSVGHLVEDLHARNVGPLAVVWSWRILEAERTAPSTVQM